ncbi:MAG: hypothetical protein ACYSU0_23060 [Planctomycetota bacterium]
MPESYLGVVQLKCEFESSFDGAAVGKEAWVGTVSDSVETDVKPAGGPGRGTRKQDDLNEALQWSRTHAQPVSPGTRLAALCDLHSALVDENIQKLRTICTADGLEMLQDLGLADPANIKVAGFSAGFVQASTGADSAVATLHLPMGLSPQEYYFKLERAGYAWKVTHASRELGTID